MSSELWRRVSDAFTAMMVDARLQPEFEAAAEAFLAPGVERAPSLRTALRSGNRQAAITIARRLAVDERRELLGELLLLASRENGLILAARQLILSLPHDWLLQHLESAVEPLLERGDAEEFLRFIELYADLNKELALRLARRAAAAADPEVREVGASAIQWLPERRSSH
jgi:hypothetical protein